MNFILSNISNNIKFFSYILVQQNSPKTEVVASSATETIGSIVGGFIALIIFISIVRAIINAFKPKKNPSHTDSTLNDLKMENDQLKSDTYNSLKEENIRLKNEANKRIEELEKNTDELRKLQEEINSNKFCKYCGAKLEKNTNRCKNCNAPIKED